MEKQQIVKYGNQINNLTFKGFKPTDLDLFMALCLAIKDKGTSMIEISYSDLMRMSGFRHATTDELHENLKNHFGRKIFGLKFAVETKEEYAEFILFDYFKANKANKTLTLGVSKRAAQYFNDLVGTFTMLDLAIYNCLGSKYSKLLYQHLCQYRNKEGTGYWAASLESFKLLMGVPLSYQNKDVMKEIIKPAISELSNVMSITVETQRGQGKGRPVEGYRFDFEEVRKIKGSKRKPSEPRQNGTGEEKEIEQIMDAAGGIDEASAKTIHKTAKKHKWTTQQVIDLISKTKRLDGIESIGAYVVNCIKNGIHNPVATLTKPRAKNQFNNFPQRKRTPEEYSELARKLAKQNFQEISNRSETKD